MTTEEFIALHAQDDVARLALHAPRTEGVDFAFALTQIAALQTARRKLPSWAATGGIVWPERLPMEQCSSEATARIKRHIVERWLGEEERGTMADLTGGLGVDFSFIASLFRKAVYIEKNVNLCGLAEKNFQLLNLTNAVIENGSAEEFISQTEPLSFVYIDPARRKSGGQRAFALSDCQPDIGQILPQTMAKCLCMMAKLSPMLDLKAVSRCLAPHLAELHIVESEGECKELLALCCDNRKDGSTTVVCHTPKGEISFPIEECGQAATNVIESENIADSKIIFLPYKSLSKASPCQWLSRRYGVATIAHDSHVFLSRNPIADFPGRQFRLLGACTMKSPALQALLPASRRANVAVRNFPLSAEQLRRRLKLSDGGETYIIGTTAANGAHIILVCEKLPATD